MWFWFALIALLCWSGSDLFSKIGCQDSSDKYSHLKMVMAVGIVMGLHAAYEIFIGKVGITWEIILMYLPVSMLYILSMAIGYLGLRYIELSISSPICNSSGAIVAVLTLITVGIGDDLPPLALVAVALVCIGVIALGITESNEDEELRRARQDESNRHYAKSWLAIALPVLYCLLDALGTFADSRVLEKLGEELADACNVAYELTFLVMGIACAIYVLGIKKQRLIPSRRGRSISAPCVRRSASSSIFTRWPTPSMLPLPRPSFPPTAWRALSGGVSSSRKSSRKSTMHASRSSWRASSSWASSISDRFALPQYTMPELSSSGIAFLWKTSVALSI